MNTIKQYFEKAGVNWEYFSLRFWVAGIILSIAFSFLFISFNKAYTSSMIIFVNAKSETTALQKDQIISNISEFPKTLALYDRLLKYNSDVKDLAADKPPAERKEYWNDLVSSEKISEDSSLIKISITTAQKNDAEKLAKKTTETLLYFTSVYYNIKDEIDLRIIENPATNLVARGWVWIIPLSLIMGFLFTFFFQYILLKRREIIANEYEAAKENFLYDFKKEPVEISAEDEKKSLENLYLSDIPADIPVEPKKTFAGAIISGIQEMKKITKTLEKDKGYPNFPEVPKRKTVVASAPDNLPVADESFLKQSTINIEQPTKPETQESPEIKIHPEPDQEQLKKRLNDLLRGGL